MAQGGSVARIIVGIDASRKSAERIGGWRRNERANQESLIRRATDRTRQGCGPKTEVWILPKYAAVSLLLIGRFAG
jgi:hypothetical protein